VQDASWKPHSFTITPRRGLLDCPLDELQIRSIRLSPISCCQQCLFVPWSQIWISTISKLINVILVNDPPILTLEWSLDGVSCDEDNNLFLSSHEPIAPLPEHVTGCGMLWWMQMWLHSQHWCERRPGYVPPPKTQTTFVANSGFLHYYSVGIH